MELNSNDNISVKKTNDILLFYVNGKKVVEQQPDPETTLLTYLRNTLGLCGTKLGCGEGGCGACTVMVSKYDRKTTTVKHFAVNACLMPVCMVYGLAITTVEGIGSTKTKLHPVQERIAKSYGSQCGFCTPGIVMSMYALLRSLPKPTLKDVEIAFQGNLCRCTGYRPIIEGYRTFTEEFKCRMGENCCKNIKNLEPVAETFQRNDYMPYDPSQEPIFPPELKLFDDLDKNSLVFKSDRVTWYRPNTLNDLLAIKSKHKDTKIVTGNTEIGVEVKFKYFNYPNLAAPSLIPELNEITTNDKGILVGASASLYDLENKLREQIDTLPEYKTRLFTCIVDMLQYFAGRQIRNVASLGGNIMTGSPISDLNPILMAAAVQLNVASVNGSRTLKLDENFFTGYRRNILKSDEILISIFIPQTIENQYFIAYKQAKRREDDIAIVNFALNVIFENNTNIIQNIRMTYGGIAPTTVYTKNTCKHVIGMKWNNEIVEIINDLMVNELPLEPDAPGGMILYRRSLTLSLFFKAYLKICEKLGLHIDTDEKSGSTVFHTLETKSSQFYEIVKNTEYKTDPVGKPKVHLSAFKQATGEAMYTDDISHTQNELYLALVLSTKAHAKILGIDPSEALKQPGVHKFFSSQDLTEEQNKYGPVFPDDEVFANKICTHYGQVIGAVIADTQAIAQRASRMVKVEYEEISPIIISMEDAIKYNSFFDGCPKTIRNGNVEESFKLSDHIIEGEARMGGQEHFYLETNVALAIPRDPDELEIYCSSQHPSEVQLQVGHLLGIPSSHIVVKTKRLGGGFGGKESRASVLALPVAFAAYKLNCPIRCMLDRDEDMLVSGGRNPFLFKYKVGFTSNGKILGCHIRIYNNGGNTRDLSLSVLDRAMLHFQNVYNIPNVLVEGWSCKTNIVSNTAFRGFGGPQGMFAAEHIIRDVAMTLNTDYINIVELNIYQKGDFTHYNQEIEEDNLRRCWDEVIKNSDFYQRKQEVDRFNSKNRWKKRGISLVPTQFGISFTVLFLNQAGALIHIYEDGSVLISHGGTEMGQGLHTKMIQVASKCLNIPMEKIHIAETATDKVPNASATAASASSDLNGMAIIDACEKLICRLEPFKSKYPEKDWNFWVLQAFLNRVSLSATGFHATPGIGADRENNRGRLFNYYTHGAACTEVEIDCLTGDHQLIRTDIVMDLGSSLNPTIDIGQIEGAFVQGYGLFTLEELIFSSKGVLLSRGPGMYKIPGFFDIPAEFNVSLLTGCANPKAVYSSKAVGEPPLFLASSAFFALKEAINAARKNEKLSERFKFDSPATAARIRMACNDRFTKKFEEPEIDTFTPWNIAP